MENQLSADHYIIVVKTYFTNLFWDMKKMSELRTLRLYSNGLNAIRLDFP